MGDGVSVRPERGGFTLREVAQSAVERPLLGEFVEVVVRVPLDRGDSPASVWGLPVDSTHADIAEYLADAYLSLAGFVADVMDMETTQVRVRLRARQGQDMLRDEFVNIWGDASGTGTATE